MLNKLAKEAQRKYWKSGTAVCLTLDIWKFAGGNEEQKYSLWVDDTQDPKSKEGNFIFKGNSLEELEDFLGKGER